MIDRGVCSNENYEEYGEELSKKKLQEMPDQVAANPILLYKLIKETNWFYYEIYLPKLHGVISNKGELGNTFLMIFTLSLEKVKIYFS